MPANTCDTCGNSYANTFLVKKDGQEHRFDSLECAIQKLAPTCARCSCRVIGHGIDADNKVYCCAHCARNAGVEGVADSV